MAYMNKQEQIRENHEEFVEISGEAKKEGLNYGQYVGKSYLRYQPTIQEKLAIMRECGTYTHEKVKDRKESPRERKNKEKEECTENLVKEDETCE